MLGAAGTATTSRPSSGSALWETTLPALSCPCHASPAVNSKDAQKNQHHASSFVLSTAAVLLACGGGLHNSHAQGSPKLLLHVGRESLTRHTKRNPLPQAHKTLLTTRRLPGWHGGRKVSNSLPCGKGRCSTTSTSLASSRRPFTHLLSCLPYAPVVLKLGPAPEVIAVGGHSPVKPVAEPCPRVVQVHISVPVHPLIYSQIGCCQQQGTHQQEPAHEHGRHLHTHMQRSGRIMWVKQHHGHASHCCLCTLCLCAIASMLMLRP